jgi:ribosomal protein S6--L-glutamate ligase
VRLAVLSRNPSLHSTERLRAAGAARGHDVQVIDYLRCYMNITSLRPTVMYQGKELPALDAVIPRIGCSHTVYGTAVVRQFEMLGAASTNDPEAITRSHDKLRCLQLLAAAGLELPSTGFAHASRDISGLIECVSPGPLVVKLLNGLPGTGAILAETHQAAEAVMEAFGGLDANSLVQEFIREAAGSSLRLFVVGRRVVAAMRRQARPGEYRSNLHRGGNAEKVRPTPAERRAAVLAAQTLGLDVAGVDMLQSKRGPLVMAVNSSPELEGIERVAKVDVAGKIYQFLEGRLAARHEKQSRTGKRTLQLAAAAT